MFDEIRHYFHLKKLQARRRHLNSKYVHMKLSGREGDLIEGAVDASELRELETTDDEIALLQTEFLVSQAEKYLLPLPKKDDGSSWIESEFRSIPRLSDDALLALRKSIRAEQRERWETWYRWVVLLIGLLGVLIGLVSMLKK